MLMQIAQPVLLHPALVERPGELLHGDVPHEVVSPLTPLTPFLVDGELDPARGAPHHFGVLLARLAHHVAVPVNIKRSFCICN